MNKLILVTMLFGFTAHAENIYISGLAPKSNAPVDHDEWCENNAGRFEGGYAVCGVGRGSDEGSARERALRAGLEEFEQTCELSSDCKNRHRTVQPGRSNCASAPSGATICHRLIRVIFLE